MPRKKKHRPISPDDLAWIARYYDAPPTEPQAARALVRRVYEHIYREPVSRLPPRQIVMIGQRLYHYVQDIFLDPDKRRDNYLRWLEDRKKRQGIVPSCEEVESLCMQVVHLPKEDSTVQRLERLLKPVEELYGGRFQSRRESHLYQDRTVFP